MEALDGAKCARRQAEDSADELEYAADYDAQQTEGQQDQPDDGEEYKRKQRRGPADDEQDQEEEKLHGWSNSVLK